MLSRLSGLVIALSALVLSQAVPASANDAASGCKGTDMIAELKSQHPKIYAALLREEKKILHREGLLFKMSKKGLPDIHVFGTIHVDDPRLKEFPEVLIDALENADIVATEIQEGEMTNPVTMLKMAALAANPKADTLTRLKPAAREALTKALEARGLPSGAATRMDAGFLLLSLALPPCAMVTDPAKALDQEVVDSKIARIGIASGAENIGLETVVSQINAIKGMSDASKFALLNATASMDDRSEDLFATMKNLYLDKKIGRLSVLSYIALPPDPAVQGGYAEFQDRLIDKRNREMAKKIEELAKDKKVVAAVGALHLIGETGVVNLLEKRGYKATKLW
jgi:uncharacterized protein